MPVPYSPPDIEADAFNCPFCHAYSTFRKAGVSTSDNTPLPLRASQCQRCGKWVIWLSYQHKDSNGTRQIGRMVHPDESSAPLPHAELPESVAGDYLEARSLGNRSPRAAAALLRLCLQKLCKELGEKGDNANDDIASLVKKGLDPTIQMALDVVRVTGNHAVHPGEMQLTEDDVTVESLFGLINAIVEERISRPRIIRELYEKLPERDRLNIEKRDGRINGKAEEPPKA